MKERKENKFRINKMTTISADFAKIAEDNGFKCSEALEKGLSLMLWEKENNCSIYQRVIGITEKLVEINKNLLETQEKNDFLTKELGKMNMIIIGNTDKILSKKD